MIFVIMSFSKLVWYVWRIRQTDDRTTPKEHNVVYCELNPTDLRAPVDLLQGMEGHSIRPQWREECKINRLVKAPGATMFFLVYRSRRKWLGIEDSCIFLCSLPHWSARVSSRSKYILDGAVIPRACARGRSSSCWSVTRKLVLSE